MARLTRCLVCVLACSAAPLFAGQQFPEVAEAVSQPSHSGEEHKAAVEFGWRDRPTVTFGGKLRLAFKARLQGDLNRSEAPLESARALTDVERQRVGIEGNLGKALEFAVTRELTDPAPWRDAYVNYRQFDVARLQGGRFKVPFSLDENTGAASLDFVNRSMAASALAPGRDQGVMLHGRLWSRVLSYEAGVFTHDGDNARARDDLSTPAGRTTAFRVSTASGGKSGFHAAAAVASSDVPATIWTIRGRTSLEDSFFPALLWVQGERRRIGLEARWATGPLSIQSEYMRLTQERLAQGVQDSDLVPVVASGWYVSGTWALTGSTTGKARKRQSPPRSVFSGGRGAIELAVRFEALTFGHLGSDDDASVSPRAATVLGNRDRALTLGLNWSLSPHLRLQGNVIRDALHDPSRGPLPSQPAYWSSVLRLQVGM